MPAVRNGRDRSVQLASHTGITILSSLSFNTIHGRFNTFVETYYTNDSVVMDNILLKQNHSVRVSALSEQIALSLGMNDYDVNICKCIGLLHDMGRFPQFTQYRTFRDNLSVDHAELGIQYIASSGIIEEAAPDDQRIICCAVQNHNKIRISEDLDEHHVLHSRIIRDADKLDIIPIMLDYYEQRKSKRSTALELGFADTPGYNPEIIDIIMRSEEVPNEIRYNFNDLILCQMAWLLDLNTTYSYEYVRTHEFRQKMSAFLPSDARIDNALQYIDHVICERCGV